MKIPELSKQQWITVAVVAVVIIVLVFVAVHFGKKHKKKKDDKDKIDEFVERANALQNAGGAPSQLTSVQIKSVAQQIRMAMTEAGTTNQYAVLGGWGTDEEKMLSAIRSIPTAADYFLVKASYQEQFHSDMWNDIKDEFEEKGSWWDSFGDDSNDAYVFGCIKEHLTEIGVPARDR